MTPARAARRPRGRHLGPRHAARSRTPVSWLGAHAGEIAAYTLQHLALCGTSFAIALAIAVPLGLLAAKRGRVGIALIALLDAIYTIPSLALFALLIPLLGLGFWTAVTALTAYAQVILVRNIVAAVRSVPPWMVDAARGLGMTPLQVFTRVELPVGAPVVIAGARVAAVSIIAFASVAAWIDAGGLGTLIFAGIERQDIRPIAAGTLSIAALALAADAALRAMERLLRAAG
ncbi:ABC transporter permease [bacterium]|nr:MAG: ABC transporter permease [bacterium]